MNLLKRSLIFSTFILCCVSLALVAAAIATPQWFAANCRQRVKPMAASVSQIRDSDSPQDFRQNSTGHVNFGLFKGQKNLNVGFGERISYFEVNGKDGLLSQGLWAGTIGCLAGGLLFSAVGAVFAIINTATSPVEAITGIPGLYIWNAVAALCELIAVILWSVQHSTRLNHNVLLIDSKQGWTTEGNEKLGFSFWLMVVAIVAHIGNCCLIKIGTHEPKAKEKIQEPDKATNDILLY